MKALIVDDDRTLADVLAFTLRREGFQVILAYDGQMALQRWEEESPDIIILDVNLPRLDGFTVCQQIRQQADTPILLLTVRGEEEDIVRGLRLGADDYITKPFSPRQLVARMQAILRRIGQIPTLALRRLGDLTLDLGRRELVVGNQAPVTLTALEARLLDFLTSNPGQVMTTESIIDYVWGPRGADRDMVRQLVHRLRLKIEPDPNNPEYIETVAGLGYGFLKSNEIN